MGSTYPCRIVEGKALRTVTTKGLFHPCSIPCTQDEQSSVDFCLLTSFLWKRYCKWLLSHHLKPLVKIRNSSNNGTTISPYPTKRKMRFRSENNGKNVYLLLRKIWRYCLCVIINTAAFSIWAELLDLLGTKQLCGLDSTGLIKDSVSLIACWLGRGTKGGGKKQREASVYKRDHHWLACG